MTPLALTHAVCASLVPVGASVSMVVPRARRIAGTTGALAVIALATALASLHAWEPTYRRAVFIVSHTAGVWLDRKAHFGIVSFAFALSGALAILDDKVPRWILRLLWCLAALFGFAALTIALVLRARVVPAAIY